MIILIIVIQKKGVAVTYYGKEDCKKQLGIRIITEVISISLLLFNVGVITIIGLVIDFKW